MVIPWLLHSVDREIAESIIYCKTTAEMWNQLKTRYLQTNHATLYQLQRDLALTSQGSRSISVYFTQFQKLWDEYTNMIECMDEYAIHVRKILQHQQIMQLLIGLNECYNVVRGNILMTKPFPQVYEVLQMLLQKEKQREICNPSQVAPDASTFYTNRNNAYGRGRGNFNAGRGRSHFENNTTGRGRLFCDHYKVPGHYAQRCYKMDAQFDKLVNLLNSTSVSNPSGECSSSHALMAGISLCSVVQNVSHNWILDSGATDHITPNLSLFTCYQALSISSTITIPDDSQISIHHIGNVTLSQSLNLLNVLHIPSFQYNLISISKLCYDLKASVILKMIVT
ncbi:hypothetical protein LIER_38422 [Lithospermum erythrorhizon]|uniref:Retrovirus-related Pol polyprotein from transposon TNT 1-94-like beta-barrel domain-containing protein n=1 Tax=Lithospermum erythrorhizon TaxID=34254 RepID=A0AAV3PZP5_LITER